MNRARFVQRSRVTASAAELFRWHAREGAFERLTPAWERVKVLARSGGIKDGGILKLQVQVGPFKQLWVANHLNYQEDRQFCDQQTQGPFAYWLHTHRMQPVDEHASYLEDDIEYQLPLGWLGNLVGGAYTRKKLLHMFNYRHFVTVHDLAAHQSFQQRVGSMKIAIMGASGLVGSTLIPFLTSGGHEVYRFVRTKTTQDPHTIYWNPATKSLDLNLLEGFDAVISLSGENIAEGRWTAEKKARIRSSRIDVTRFLAESLTKLQHPPHVWLSASAMGYYGDRGAETMREENQVGTGFLPEVCQEWEDATNVASDNGIRVVNLRIGAVLSPQEGALAKMLPPFQFGLGGKLGNGQQYFSWIAIDDVIGAIYHALAHEDIHGPVNLVSPNSVTNADFTRTLGKVLSRPTIFAVPAFALRLALGEMADALLLASIKVHPGKLLATGYNFRHADLEAALRHLLGK